MAVTCLSLYSNSEREKMPECGSWVWVYRAKLKRLSLSCEIWVEGRTFPPFLGRGFRFWDTSYSHAYKCERFNFSPLRFVSSFPAVIKTSNTADSRRAYQCIKFLVQLANKCPQAKDYLLQNSSRWQWAVQWLKRKMNEHYWAPHTSSSNEYSSSRTFQRTSSAADTLAEATALLTELEAKDGEVSTSDDVDDSAGKFEIGGQEDWEKEMTN